MANLRSDTEILKCTYAELVAWVKELLWSVQRFRNLEDLNFSQAKRIMELEFDIRKLSHMMVDDKQETVMKEYGSVQSDVVSNEEFQSLRLKRKGSGGGGGAAGGDWLSPMVWGTEFLVRPKVQKTWLLVKFMMAGIRNGAVLLIPMQGDEPVQDDKQWIWVDPKEYCKYWELMTILMVPEEKNE